ncbi:MAG TPA: S8 family serine peptidase, partial [Verrucomicrobiae bacterium]|nr:S8 family serine peptidase [Verrucomicrobiae bacterium]
VHGFNSINLSGDPMDDAGHGTHVSGIIGAVGNNGVGIAGVAWNVKLMACKFLDSTGDGDTSDAIRCVDYARRNGAQVINASWGGGDYSAALYTAIQNARAAGIIFVTAAGNDAENIDQLPIYPACYNLDNIVVVGGTTRADILDPGYSSFGPLNVDLCAPGTGIYSTWFSWDGAYQHLSGTSMAAPHVAGVLALMRARFTNMTSSQIIERLYSTVDVLPALAGKCKTSGRVNLGRALGGEPAANFSASKIRGEPPLAVAFTNLTLGELRSASWDFGDASLVETNRNASHVFVQNGTYKVRLTVVGTNNRTNSIEQVVQVVSEYEIAPETFEWVEPTGMAPLSLSDNGFSAAQELSFDFKFYSETYHSVFVGANGVLAFTTNGLSTTSNTSLPNSDAPNAILCPYWDNLNPGGGGSVYAGIDGTAPHRRFVVSWVNVPRNSTTTTLTFQAILEEGTSEAVFQYLEVHPESSRGGARRATVGVENANGSNGTLYTYNGAPYVLTNQSALRVRAHAYRYLHAETSPIELKVTRGEAAGTNTLLRMSNPGTLDLDWSIETAESWLSLTQAEGTLRGGDSVAIPISVAEAARLLTAGNYSGTIVLRNKTDGSGGAVIPVLLQVERASAVLSIEAVSGTRFSGGLGGPFTPSALKLRLRNTGNVALEWKGSADATWLQLNPAAGLLLPGAAETVNLSLSAEAELLGSGISTGTVRFTNLTSASNLLEQQIELEVRSKIEQTATALVNGVFRAALTVPEGASYQVEYSEDLENWNPLNASQVVSQAELTFEDLA